MTIRNLVLTLYPVGNENPAGFFMLNLLHLGNSSRLYSVIDG